MGNKNYRIALVLVAVLMSGAALAQNETKIDTVASASGFRLNNNRNLRFTQKDRVHTEISLGGHVSGSGYTTGGADVMVTRVYTPGQYFGWRGGAMVSMDYHQDYGATSDLMAVFGVRFGNAVSFGIDALAGVGQMPFHDYAWKGESHHDYYNSLWRFKVGGQASLNFRLGEKVNLSLFGRYTYAVNDNSTRTLNLPDGWESKPTEFHNSRWFAGLALSFNILNETRVSGDNCWTAGVYSGYSFLGNEGWVLGAEMLKFKRTGARGGYVVGLGTMQTTSCDGAVSANQVYAQAGYRVLPWGASSVLEIEFGAKAGAGEYAKTEQGWTDDNRFKMGAATMSMGVVGKGYVGLNLHFGRHEVKIAGEFGGHVCFGTRFVGEENYTGKTSRLNNLDASALIGYSFAF